MSDTTRRLRLSFTCESNDTRTLTIPDPKPTAQLDAATVGAAMTAIVENGDAFADPLTAYTKAELVETTRTVIVDNA